MAYLFATLVGIAIFIVIFLALRHIMLWYWKVDTIITNQEQVIKLMEQQILQQGQYTKSLEKHNLYMENNIHTIKQHLTEPK